MNKKLLTSLCIAIILPLIWLVCAKKIAIGQAENSVDCYYHIALADNGPSAFCSKTFPQMTLSIWQTHFSDKELIYHFVLYCIRRSQYLLGLNSNAPFYVPFIIFSSMLLLAFFFVCKEFKIECPYIFCFLLVLISPSFVDRIFMLRPHVFSITLMLLSCIIFKRITTYKQLILAFLFAYFYSWSYSNPHFLLIPACAFAITKYKHSKPLTFLIPLTTFIGLVTGLLIHPQFPNTFINWKIQCIDVLLQAVSSSLPITIGNEFKALSVKWCVINLLLFLTIISTYFSIIFILIKKGLNKISNETIAITLISGIFSFGLLFGIRSIEYACPFIILTLGLVIGEFKKNEMIPSWLFNRYRFVQLCIILFIVAIININILSLLHNRLSLHKPLTDFSGWMKTSKIPEGEIIGNLIWSDFPFLYYSLPNYRFLYGVDPMFAYAKHPNILKDVAEFRNGKLKLSSRELASRLGCQYLFVRKIYKDGKKLKAQGYKVLYEGPDGWLFKLNGAESL